MYYWSAWQRIGAACLLALTLWLIALWAGA